MTWTQRVRVACAVSFAALSVLSLAATAEPTQAEKAATSAAAASPALVGALAKELGATPAQAAGAAGALFRVAQSRLKPSDFSQVAGAVPGMTSLLSAAPNVEKASGTSGTAGATKALSQIAKPAAGLAGAMSAFSQLGLKPDQVAKAIPILTSFVTKSGGANVGNLLAGALK
jgi:hypothetical protein